MILSPQLAGRFERPSNREVGRKLIEAIALIKRGKWFPANPEKLRANFEELEYVFNIDVSTGEDQTTILVTSLLEIKPEHYAGGRPPQKSYEPAARGLDMFAFRWNSNYFPKTDMYLKFCLHGNEESRRACMFSIHPDRGD